MKFPLFFQRDRSPAAQRDRQEHAEKLIAESLRLLGQICGKLADAVDAQRLTRAGYEEPGKFLKRTERDDKK
jgi:hypothetical protein